MTAKDWKSLICWIITFEVIGLLLGLLTQLNIPNWYNGLHKSQLTPPPLVFSIVWPVLYLLLAISGWVLWQQRKKKAIRPTTYFFFIQLFMNWAWTPIFFGLHWIGFSFLWILIMTLLTFFCIHMLKDKMRRISILLLPYFLWLVFASYLNGVICFYN
ncbi:MAG: tryptophan-rich sensory protein [Tatlockia sp.]|nr:tryptophan-rich sensory protein [Tatlockia sp.]